VKNVVNNQVEVGHQVQLIGQEIINDIFRKHVEIGFFFFAYCCRVVE